MFVAWTHKKQTATFLSQVIVDSKSGRSSCQRCPAGTHNPDPTVYTQCACLPYLERRHDATCQPCAIGFYKTFDMRHSEPCVQCPADKIVSDVGSKRFCFARVG